MYDAEQGWGMLDSDDLHDDELFTASPRDHGGIMGAGGGVDFKSLASSLQQTVHRLGAQVRCNRVWSRFEAFAVASRRWHLLLRKLENF